MGIIFYFLHVSVFIFIPLGMFISKYPDSFQRYLDLRSEFISNACIVHQEAIRRIFWLYANFLRYRIKVVFFIVFILGGGPFFSSTLNNLHPAFLPFICGRIFVKQKVNECVHMRNIRLAQMPGRTGSLARGWIVNRTPEMRCLQKKLEIGSRLRSTNQNDSLKYVTGLPEQILFM